MSRIDSQQVALDQNRNQTFLYEVSREVNGMMLPL